MSFAQDLLEQAQHLIDWDGADPKQASLRRAVSTAYYALFHLLIDESVGNWAVARQRSKLARTFEHRSMKRVCDDCVKDFRSAGKPGSKLLLTEVAETFCELQLKRTPPTTTARTSGRKQMRRIGSTWPASHSTTGMPSAPKMNLRTSSSPSFFQN